MAHPPPRSEAYDVVVVGSGLGGISAAALLARAGREVLVVERGESPGGYAQAFRRGPYTFDPAVHILADPEFMGNVLDYLGVREQVNLMPVDDLFHAVYPDLRLEMPFGFEELSDAFCERFPNEAPAIRAFFELSEGIILEASLLPHHLELKDLEAAMERAPNVFKYRTATVKEVFDEQFDDPRLVSLLATMWPYSAVPPSRAGFLWFAQFIGTLVRGTRYCEGGFQKLVDAFVTAIETHGGEVLLESEVQEIIVSEGRATGVRLSDGAEIRASAVVSNADARHTLEDLVGLEQLPRAYARRLKRLTPSLSACSVYAATSLDLRELGVGHETFVYKHWDHEQTYADIMSGRPGGMWISAPSLLDSSLAPPGEQVVILTSLCPYDVGKPWQEAEETFSEALLGELEQVFPGFREQIRYVELATPLTLERHSRNQGGALYGWEATPRQTASGRLTHETPIGGLYLSGHWTQQGHGSLRTVVSGDQTARLVLTEDGETDPIPSFRPAYLPPKPA